MALNILVLKDINNMGWFPLRPPHPGTRVDLEAWQEEWLTRLQEAGHSCLKNWLG